MSKRIISLMSIMLMFCLIATGCGKIVISSSNNSISTSNNSTSELIINELELALLESNFAYYEMVLTIELSDVEGRLELGHVYAIKNDNLMALYDYEGNEMAYITIEDGIWFAHDPLGKIEIKGENEFIKLYFPNISVLDISSFSYSQGKYHIKGYDIIDTYLNALHFPVELFEIEVRFNDFYIIVEDNKVAEMVTDFNDGEISYKMTYEFKYNDVREINLP